MENVKKTLSQLHGRGISVFGFAFAFPHADFPLLNDFFLNLSEKSFLRLSKKSKKTKQKN